MAVDPLAPWAPSHFSPFTAPRGLPSDRTSTNLRTLVAWSPQAPEHTVVVLEAEEVDVAEEIVRDHDFLQRANVDVMAAGIGPIATFFEEAGATAVGLPSAANVLPSFAYHSFLMPAHAAMFWHWSEMLEGVHVAPEIVDVSVPQRLLEVHGIEIPPVLSHLEAPIRSSRAMLELEDDWDDEGSPRYDEETWNRAVKLMVDTAEAFWEDHGSVAPAPRIGKGPEGSIDLHWLMLDRELLINIPASEEEPVTFYGEDSADQQSTVEGRMPQSESDPWLLEWLTK